MEEMVKSVMFFLSTNTSKDPAVQEITEDNVKSLFTEVMKSNELDLEDFDDTKSSYVKMLVMRELFWKLALASAPMYEVSIDGLRVSKQTRFDHYYKLISLLQKQIKELLEANPALASGGRIKVETSIINKPYTRSRDKALMYFNKLKKYMPEIIVDKQENGITFLTVKFKPNTLADFLRYDFYYSESLIVDDYEENKEIDAKATLLRYSYDIMNNRFKIPILEGYVVIVVTLKTGEKLYKQLQITKVGE